MTMAITATLDTVTKTDLPLVFAFGVTYTDSDNADWHLSKVIPITVDPTQTVPQKLAAIRAAVTADATPYKQQSGIYAGLLSLVGQTIVLP